MLVQPQLKANNSIAKSPHSKLPDIPEKIYFTIGEVSELCLLKPHVLRYWEHEFTQLRPMKRCGNRRYYQRDEVLLIRKIRNLLYDQGFTIEGARAKLAGENKRQAKVSGVNSELIKNIIAELEDVLTDLT